MRLCILFSVVLVSTFAKKLPDIYWNSTSPLNERYAAIGDFLDIHCPYFEDDVHPSETEQSIIYRVPEEDYEKCKVSSQAEVLGKCTNPYRKQKWTASLRQFSPNPSALAYKPGTTYFFISTSTGSIKGLENDIGGLCASHNLKMIIHVTSRNGDTRGLSHRHHHHHHRKPTTTTPAPPLQWPDSPMWGQFIEKVAHDPTWPRMQPSRAERVSLDAGNEKDRYPVFENDIIDFQIHEIGEVESLFSSSRSTSLAVVMLMTSLLLLRL